MDEQLIQEPLGVASVPQAAQAASPTPVDAAGQPTEPKAPVDIPLTRDERTNLGRLVLLEEKFSQLEATIIKQAEQLDEFALVKQDVDSLKTHLLAFAKHLASQWGGAFASKLEELLKDL